MAFMDRMADAAVLGMAMLIGCGLSASPARATYTVTLMQQGSNVVANGSGTIDTAGLSFVGSQIILAGIFPFQGEIITGPGGTPSAVDVYAGFTGPTSFGAGRITGPNLGGGDIVGINGFLEGLFVPRGYISGSLLSDSSTYENQTFASLSATPGTYVWMWGNGSTADSFTLQIGPAAMPEPASFLLLALPLGLAALATIRRGPSSPKRRAVT